MPAFTDLTGLWGLAFAIAATVVALPGVRRLGPSRLRALFPAVLILALVPLGALSAAAGVRGAVGDLSITTLVLLGGAIIWRLTGAPPMESRGRFAVLGFVAAAALALYPMALGIGLFDPYRLGYGSPWLLGALFSVALVAWLGRAGLLAACLALATLAWSVRWYESSNLWDYLLDPLVTFYALGALAADGVKRVIRSLRAARGANAPGGARAAK